MPPLNGSKLQSINRRSFNEQTNENLYRLLADPGDFKYGQQYHILCPDVVALHGQSLCHAAIGYDVLPIHALCDQRPLCGQFCRSAQQKAYYAGLRSCGGCVQREYPFSVSDRQPCRMDDMCYQPDHRVYERLSVPWAGWCPRTRSRGSVVCSLFPKI